MVGAKVAGGILEVDAVIVGASALMVAEWGVADAELAAEWGVVDAELAVGAEVVGDTGWRLQTIKRKVSK